MNKEEIIALIQQAQLELKLLLYLFIVVMIFCAWNISRISHNSTQKSQKKDGTEDKPLTAERKLKKVPDALPDKRNEKMPDNVTDMEKFRKQKSRA